MKKKILFGILLISIFLFSTATTVQPVRGYEFGVPDQAKGMKGEGEIKIYDEDEWKAHFGSDGDRPDDIWDGDSDIVGAKSKSKILDWETDEDIKYIFDFVLQASIDSEALPTLEVYEDAIDYIYQGATGLANVTANDMPILHMVTGMAYGLYATPASPFFLDGDLGNVVGAGVLANGTAGAYPVDNAYARAKYNKKYEGVMVEMDTWDYYENADFPSKPDEKEDEAPFLADPRDWKDSYDTLWHMVHEIYSEIDKIYPLIMDFNNSLIALQNNNYPCWYTLNQTAAGALAGAGLPAATLKAILDGAGWDLPGFFVTQAYAGMAGVQPLFNTYVPQKAGYLYMQLEGGMPCYTPTADFLAKVVAEFDIDDEDVEIPILRWRGLYHLHAT